MQKLIDVYKLVFGFFQMLVDTLLLCFCEDVKINDGTEEKPYFMSKNLMVRIQYFKSLRAVLSDSLTTVTSFVIVCCHSSLSSHFAHNLSCYKVN